MSMCCWWVRPLRRTNGVQSTTMAPASRSNETNTGIGRSAVITVGIKSNYDSDYIQSSLAAVPIQIMHGLFPVFLFNLCSAVGSYGRFAVLLFINKHPLRNFPCCRFTSLLTTLVNSISYFTQQCCTVIRMLRQINNAGVSLVLIRGGSRIWSGGGAWAHGKRGARAYKTVCRYCMPKIIN